MKLAIKREESDWTLPFEGDEYVIDLKRKFEGYEKGDIICHVFPFPSMGIRLEIAIRVDGSLVFRGWSMPGGAGNPYLHTTEMNEEDAKNKNLGFLAVHPSEQQIDTVNGLFSGRIKFEGLKLAVGASLQKICPIDVKQEEKLTGKKIYLA